MMKRTEVSREGVAPVAIIDKTEGDISDFSTDLNKSVRIEDVRGNVLMVFPAGESARALAWAQGYLAGKAGV